MLSIKIGDWEHRVLLNGLVESRRVESFEATEWDKHSPAELEMTGAEYAIVREHLLALSNIFRADHTPPPRAEGVMESSAAVPDPESPR